MTSDLILKDDSIQILGRLDTERISCKEITASGAKCQELKVQYSISCDELNVRGADLLKHLDKVEKTVNELKKAITVAGNKVHGQFGDVQISGELKVQGSDFGQRVFNIERQLDELNQRLKALEG